MPKAYWISSYHAIHDEAALAAYAKLAGPSLTAAGGKFIVRGMPSLVKESGKPMRVVVIEFESGTWQEYAIGGTTPTNGQAGWVCGAHVFPRRMLIGHVMGRWRAGSPQRADKSLANVCKTSSRPASRALRTADQVEM